MIMFYWIKKSYVNLPVYDGSCQNSMGAKPLCIMFDKVVGFIKDYDGTKYLVLFGPEKYDAIYDGIYIVRKMFTSINICIN